MWLYKQISSHFQDRLGRISKRAIAPRNGQFPYIWPTYLLQPRIKRKTIQKYYYSIFSIRFPRKMLNRKQNKGSNKLTKYLAQCKIDPLRGIKLFKRGGYINRFFMWPLRPALHKINRKKQQSLTVCIKFSDNCLDQRCSRSNQASSNGHITKFFLISLISLISSIKFQKFHYSLR